MKIREIFARSKLEKHGCRFALHSAFQTRPLILIIARSLAILFLSSRPSEMKIVKNSKSLANGSLGTKDALGRSRSRPQPIAIIDLTKADMNHVGLRTRMRDAWLSVYLETLHHAVPRRVLLPAVIVSCMFLARGVIPKRNREREREREREDDVRRSLIIFGPQVVPGLRRNVTGCARDLSAAQRIRDLSRRLSLDFSFSEAYPHRISARRVFGHCK